jgi:hypothetical protein
MDGRIDTTPMAPAQTRVREALNVSGPNVFNHRTSITSQVNPDGRGQRRDGRKPAPSIRIVRNGKMVTLVIFDAFSGEIYKEIPLPGVGEILGTMNIPRECCIDQRS